MSKRIEDAAEFGLLAMAAAKPALSYALKPAISAYIAPKPILAVAAPAPARTISAVIAPKPILAVAAPVAVVARPAALPLALPASRAAAVVSPAAFLPAAAPSKSLIPVKDGISAAAGKGLAAIIAANAPDLEKEPNPADAAAIAAKYLNPGPASGGPVGMVDGGGGAPLPEFAPPEPEYQPYDGGLPPDAPSAIAQPVQSTAIVKAPEEGFWRKLLALFGFGKKKTETTISGESGSLQHAIENTVRRARSGDQNAMALMALVRDNAKKGQPRAQQSFALFQEYVRNHPVSSSNPRIGGDLRNAEYQMGVDPQLGHDSTFPDAVALSHGPKLTNPRIGRLLAHFGGEQQNAIEFGIAHRDTPNPRQNTGVRMGKILAHARRLQAVRMPGSSLKKFDADVGWELGDE